MTALITGASSGIGLELAKIFAQINAASSWSPENLNACARLPQP